MDVDNTPEKYACWPDTPAAHFWEMRKMFMGLLPSFFCKQDLWSWIAAILQDSIKIFITFWCKASGIFVNAMLLYARWAKSTISLLTSCYGALCFVLGNTLHSNVMLFCKLPWDLCKLLWTHWDLSPGPSTCGADVIPLHHVPLKWKCQTWAPRS